MNHFHGFLAELGRQCGQAFNPKNPVEFWSVEAADLISNALTALPSLRFYALVVDEAQDFLPELWLVLDELNREDSEGALFLRPSASIFSAKKMHTGYGIWWKLADKSQKPGRPSHTYHTCMIANLRLILGVEVKAGSQSHSSHRFLGLISRLSRFSEEQKPAFVRGDIGWGTDTVMGDLERIHQPFTQIKKVE